MVQRNERQLRLNARRSAVAHSPPRYSGTRHGESIVIAGLDTSSRETNGNNRSSSTRMTVAAHSSISVKSAPTMMRPEKSRATSSTSRSSMRSSFRGR
jgi:hypothetical protein